MRTTLKYAAAVGFLDTAFSTVGPVSAYAGQIPGTSQPVSITQQAKAGSPDYLQGQMLPRPHYRHCVRWGYYHHHHRYCEHWSYY